MVFDMTLATIGYTVDPDEENGGLTVTMAVGMQLPISPGPGQPPLMVPLGQIRFPIAKSDGMKMGQAIIDAAESLPDESSRPDILIADRMPDIDVGAIERKLRG